MAPSSSQASFFRRSIDSQSDSDMTSVSYSVCEVKQQKHHSKVATRFEQGEIKCVANRVFTGFSGQTSTYHTFLARVLC